MRTKVIARFSNAQLRVKTKDVFMPNYSPVRTVFSSFNKNIKNVPFDEVLELYMDAKRELIDTAQADEDDRYEQLIAAKEREYCNNNEAPYEGNFRDEFKKNPVNVTPLAVEKKFSASFETQFLLKYGIPAHIDWILEAAVTIIGQMRVYKDDEDLLDPVAFRNENFKDSWSKGLYLLLKVNTKSQYLKLQYKAPHKAYGALVPFIMYAQRLAKNIPYSAWSRDGIDAIVHTDLAEAMCFTGFNYTKEQIIERRTEGLTIKSGRGMGTMKNPVTTHRLTHGSDPDWNSIPTLAQVMYAQIWMAHPSNRTKYMILDPENWDRMPPALIPSEVVAVTEPALKFVSKISDCPWL